VREWTRERDIALVLDEVQCGLGRAGTFFAHEPSGIRPDVVCIAKPLGGGLPMGAVLMTEDIASQLQPGDHGTTFGGGPLVASVALAVLRVVVDSAFLEAVRSKGAALGAKLERIAAARKGRIREVRGRGLIWGVEMSEPAAPLVGRALQLGLLLVAAGPSVLRFLPPLTVTEGEIDRAIAILEEVLA
jgi:acetylornithine/succinyldiaminopimelate/putrescine aminotransferase